MVFLPSIAFATIVDLFRLFTAHQQQKQIYELSFAISIEYINIISYFLFTWYVMMYTTLFCVFNSFSSLLLPYLRATSTICRWSKPRLTPRKRTTVLIWRRMLLPRMLLKTKFLRLAPLLLILTMVHLFPTRLLSVLALRSYVEQPIRTLNSLSTLPAIHPTYVFDALYISYHFFLYLFVTWLLRSLSDFYTILSLALLIYFFFFLYLFFCNEEKSIWRRLSNAVVS